MAKMDQSELQYLNIPAWRICMFELHVNWVIGVLISMDFIQKVSFIYEFNCHKYDQRECLPLIFRIRYNLLPNQKGATSWSIWSIHFSRQIPAEFNNQEIRLCQQSNKNIKEKIEKLLYIRVHMGYWVFFT